MFTYLRYIDWKVQFFATLACYIAPWFLLGAVSVFLYNESTNEFHGLGALFLSQLIITPALAGYFTAKYSKKLPRVNVLVVALMGILFHELITTTSFVTQLINVILTFLMAALGAFIYLRGKAKIES